MADDLLVRRKRVDPEGEWEYECNRCEVWLPKDKFRGCTKYVDAYGNCLVCSRCRAAKALETRQDEEKESAKELLEAIGFYKYPNSECWFAERKKQLGIK
jgi:hypothetical protein